jgi:FkbM family methyltransferase
MPELILRTADGTDVAVPASLDSITTYVLLEQEKWFEKETGFLPHILKPGMTALDIGANLGVYSLPMARLVAPGYVFSYEPASEPRGLLARSKELNGAANLQLVDAALSDRPRDGTLVLGASSELNSLEGTGSGEPVRISSLDAEQQSRGWQAVDFMKIDAEGEEERILSGAIEFFARHAPLVMFEVKAGATTNDNLPAAFRTLGFGIYRLLDGAPVLVPVIPGEALDPYELNLFAARPARAAELARDGLLVEQLPNWKPDSTAIDRAAAFLKAQPFAPIFTALPGGDAVEDPVYRDALAAYATWRVGGGSLPQRVAALNFAGDTLSALCQTQATLPRLSTLARVALEAGRRGIAVGALRLMADILQRGNGQIMEPFWPANPRFDHVSPGANVVEWFVIGALEQLELTSTFSSRFGSSGVDLGWLARQREVSAEIERRWLLQRARTGLPVEIPARLQTPARGHLNAAVWRGGVLPGARSAR